MPATRVRLYVRSCVVLLLLGAPLPALAQTGAASLTGILQDQSGGALPGGTVSATNEGTAVPYTAISNASGAYTITSLPVGTYVVKVELTGFKSVMTKAVTLEANQIARLDFKLELGTVQETVEVVAESSVLQTESAAVGEVITGTTATALPLNGRNTGQLTLLLPGVVTPNPGSFTAIRNFSGGRPYVNGHREQTNNFMLDGVDMNESIDNLVPYQPSPDALAQISVETNNYSAELGNVSGAVINNVFKSGTNELRGNVFEFYRDSKFDANAWANNRSGAAKPKRTQHIFGGTVGGPVMRNRLFFFADYQGSRLDEPGSALASVAPAEWRRGDLSSVATIIRDPLTGQPFPGNIIPESRISPTARAILNDTANYPLPNRSVGGVQSNFVGQRLITTRAHQWDAKVDANLSASDKLFVRYSQAEYRAVGERQAMPLFLSGLTEGPTKNVAGNWNRVFGPSVVNEVLVGYNQVGIDSTVVDWAGIGNANAKYGIAGTQPIPGLSSVSFASGLSGLGSNASNTHTGNKTIQISEKLTWLRGRHTVKFGGQLLHLRQLRYYAGNNGALGVFQYTGTFTNFGFADFLLDQLAGKGRGSVAPPWMHLHNRTGVFAQDDFKITNDLTLNLGMRWEYTSPLVEKDDRQSNFDLRTGKQLFAGKDGNSRALYKPYYKGFEPRFGFAWTPRERWVLRGAYGIVQHMEGTGANLRLPLNPPFFFESDVRYDTSSGPGTIRTGFEGPLGQASIQARAFDPNLRPQFTHQWNTFAEYLLFPRTSVSAGYVGHRAHHLVTPIEGNQPLPGTGPVSTWAPLQQRRPLVATAPQLTNIATTAARGRSNYNALQAGARQRLSHGLELLGSYTWSKAMTNNVGYYGSGGVNHSGAYWQNAYNPDEAYGPSFFDATHNFVLSGNYELPIGRGRRWGGGWSQVANMLLGGWNVSGIMQVRSGFPITVTDTRGSSLQATRGNERPDRVGSGRVENPTIAKWIDIAAFQRAPLGEFGDSGVGILRAPGYTNLDFALGKKFAMTSTRSALVRVEAFNLLNHPSFGPPARNLADPNTFGTITSTVSAPRTVEFVLKFNF